MGQPQPRVVHPTVVRIDGRQWWVCPVKGAKCFRVPDTCAEWCQDAVYVHVRVAHRGLWTY